MTSPPEKQHERSEFQQIQKLKEENERLKNAYSKEQGTAERLTQENNSYKNKMQTAVTNICLNCIPFMNLTFRMLQHTSSEVFSYR